jgi:hypothetical protein
VDGPPFQQRPTPPDCNPNTLQAPFGPTLYVGMFDGSVRPVHHTVSPPLFWAAVTPNGGESAGLD